MFFVCFFFNSCVVAASWREPWYSTLYNDTLPQRYATLLENNLVKYLTTRRRNLIIFSSSHTDIKLTFFHWSCCRIDWAWSFLEEWLKAFSQLKGKQSYYDIKEIDMKSHDIKNI